MKGPDLHATEQTGCCDAITRTVHVTEKYLPDVNHVFKNCKLHVDGFTSPPGSFEMMSFQTEQQVFTVKLPKDSAVLQYEGKVTYFKNSKEQITF
jgi:hypothetical protein